MSMDKKDGFLLTFFLLLANPWAHSCATLGAVAPCLQWPRLMVSFIFRLLPLSTLLHVARVKGHQDHRVCRVFHRNSTLPRSSFLFAPCRYRWQCRGHAGYFSPDSSSSTRSVKHQHVLPTSSTRSVDHHHVFSSSSTFSVEHQHLLPSSFAGTKAAQVQVVQQQQ